MCLGIHSGVVWNGAGRPNKKRLGLLLYRNRPREHTAKVRSVNRSKALSMG